MSWLKPGPLPGRVAFHSDDDGERLAREESARLTACDDEPPVPPPRA